MPHTGKFEPINQEQYLAMQPRILRGIPLSDGRGEGKVWHASGGLPRKFYRHCTIPDDLVLAEIGRMRQAVQVVSFVLENSIQQVTKRLGKPYADMFVALREMLHDPSLLEAIQEHIENRHLDAGSSINTTLESFRRRFSDAPSPLLKERAIDLLELQTSLLDALVDSDNLSADADRKYPANGRDANAIAVVETLTPRLVLDLKNTNVRGIACEHAGPTSHAAILCRAFGIPAVTGIKRIHEKLPQGKYAIINGANGAIEIAGRRQALSALVFTGDHPGTINEYTMDLSQITLMANINLSKDAIGALSAGAQGVGLYRTEFEFMADNRLLTKQEQFVRYRRVVIAMMGLPVTIRLLDISVDKSAGIFGSFGGHVDPSCCGALFLLSWPELLEMQAGAIAEASLFGPVRVLYPMVADAKQFIELKKIFQNTVKGTAAEELKHGAMIEQPSAVDDAMGILEEADFACLGTNDLTKHILKVDRETAIAHGAEIISAPELWDAIGHVASVSSTIGKELTVCGEMASNLHLLPRFMGLGIRTFSMDIPKIRLIRRGPK
jgi:Phosphoenolpyruvate-protein kinase (PTS system EI component in bacteria)